MKDYVETNRFPKVSVMVPTYNHEKYIGEALDSILNDDYPNFEIVVADDSSTDSTRDILLKYLERYPAKIKLVLNEENIGVTKNCKKAFFACSGEYIALFAGDDVFLPGKLTAQVKEFINDKDVVLCYHPAEVFDSATDEVMYVTYQLPCEDIHNVRDLIVRAGFYVPSSIMVRRSACPSCGFDERLPVVSDWLFTIEVALRGRIIKVNETYSRYRKHLAGASNRSFELLDETLSTLDILFEKYPDYPNLEEFCRLGKARYIIGEAYRQLASNNVDQAYELSKRAVDLSPNLFIYRGFMYLSLGSRYCKVIRFFVVLVLTKAKFVFRKFLG